MNVSDYVKLRKAELDKFEKHWNEMVKSGNQHYPKELEEGDWYDQELAYNEVQE